MRKVLREKGIDPRKLAELLGLEDTRSAGSRFASDNNTIGFPLERLFCFSMILDTPPEKFGLSEEELVAFNRLKKAIFSARGYDLFCLSEPIAEDGYWEGYFDRHAELIPKIEQEYFVLDYLSKSEALSIKSLEAIPKLYKYHDKGHYKRLEAALAVKEKALYQRVLQPPERIAEPVEEDNLRQEYIETVIEKMLITGFTHLCRCFRDMNDDRFQLFVMPPLRAYNIYIINNDILISEYDRLDLSGRAVPDLAFVNDRHDAITEQTTERLIHYLKRDIRNILSKDHPFEKRIYADEWKAATQALYDRLTQQLSDLEECLNLAGQAFQTNAEQVASELVEASEPNTRFKIRRAHSQLKKRIAIASIEEKHRIVSEILRSCFKTSLGV